jgi:polar amino acid transport system substrate-binding protein
MKKRILVIMVACLMIISMGLTACSGNNDSTEKVLRVGVDNTYPPMEYVDESGNTVGFDVDLAAEIAKRLGMKLELVPSAWEGIFLGLDTDKYDCIISSVSMTEERMKTIDFTSPYLANGQVIAVRKDYDSIMTAEQLAGKKAGVQAGTTADEAAIKHKEKVDFELVQYDEIIQAFTELKIGRVDAVIVDAVVAMDYVSKNINDYKVTSAQLTNEPIAVAVKKGNSLKDDIQKALDEIKADGTLKALSLKWFNEDYTTNIDLDLW